MNEPLEGTQPYVKNIFLDILYTSTYIIQIATQYVVVYVTKTNNSY